MFLRSNTFIGAFGLVTPDVTNVVAMLASVKQGKLSPYFLLFYILPIDDLLYV